MPEIQVFNHPEFGQHVVRMDGRGNAVFVLEPAAQALDYARGRNALKVLDRDEYWTEVVDLPAADSSSSQVRRRVLVVSESGLYHLIFASTKPEAKKFRRWVTEELLPTVRKAQAAGIDVVEELRQRVAEQQKIIDMQNQQLIEESMDYEDYIEELLLDINGFVRVRRPGTRIMVVKSREELAAHRTKLASLGPTV